MTKIVKIQFDPDTPNHNLLELITADGAKENYFEKVYRVSDCNQINRDSFKATIEEKYYRVSPRKKTISCNRDLNIAMQQDALDIGDYSVSFFLDYDDVCKLYQLKQKKTDAPIIMEGKILPCHGFSILTKDSKTRKKFPKNSHIDLWKYLGADLVPFFKEYEV